MLLRCCTCCCDVARVVAALCAWLQRCRWLRSCGTSHGYNAALRRCGVAARMVAALRVADNTVALQFAWLQHCGTTARIAATLQLVLLRHSLWLRRYNTIARVF
ncbi:unnamed protein product [Sphagnum troendelagicum]|uniref:Secreted protein n=1 Tax=Sphagnum troendelagicum TaxID=128251 RepID=A0ABP0TKH4_9BRYO